MGALACWEEWVGGGLLGGGCLWEEGWEGNFGWNVKLNKKINLIKMKNMKIATSIPL